MWYNTEARGEGMRRTWPVILFLALVLSVFSGVFYILQKETADRQEREAADAVPEETLLVCSDIPEELLKLISDSFFKEEGIRLDITSVPTAQLTERIRSGEAPDIILTSQGILQDLKRKHLLRPYLSQDTDTVLDEFKDTDGSWTGIWLDPVVFAVNSDFAAQHPEMNYTWDQVLSRPDIRLSITDFVASDMSEDFFLSMAEFYGTDETFRKLKEAAPHVVQYGKYLSTPARLAAMGKCDIGISGLNEARRVMQEKLPIRIIYPSGGTSYYLYGAALGLGQKHQDQSEKFMDWILSSGYYRRLLAANGYYYEYTNGLEEHPDFRGAEIYFWPLKKQYTEEGKKLLLNQWINEIRFGKE